MKIKDLCTLLFFITSFSFLQTYPMQPCYPFIQNYPYQQLQSLFFFCQKCGAILPGEINILKNHLESHAITNNNQTNNNQTNNNQNNIQNTKPKTQKNFTDNLTKMGNNNDSLQKFYSIERLIKSKNKKFFICKKCGFLAKNKEEALAHLNKNDCEITGTIFSLYVKKNYVKKENSEFVCNLCGHAMKEPDCRHFSNKHLIKIGKPNNSFCIKDLLEGQKLEKSTKWSQLLREKGFTEKSKNLFYCLYPNCGYKTPYAARITDHILRIHEANPNKNLSEQTNDRKIISKDSLQENSNHDFTTKKRKREEMERPEKEENIDPVLKNSECFYNPDTFCQEQEKQQEKQNNCPDNFYKKPHQELFPNNNPNTNQDTNPDCFYVKQDDLSEIPYSEIPDIEEKNNDSPDVCDSYKDQNAQNFAQNPKQDFAQEQDPEQDFTQGFEQNFAQDPKQDFEQDFEHDFDKRPEFGNQNTNPDNFDPFANEPEKESLSDGFCEPDMFYE